MWKAIRCYSSALPGGVIRPPSGGSSCAEGALSIVESPGFGRRKRHPSLMSPRRNFGRR